MKKILAPALLVLLVSLQGCGTMAFTPEEYPLRTGLIQTMDMPGSAVASNVQPSKEQTIVYSYGGSKLATTLSDITATMVQQTNGELGKNFRSDGAGSKKTIELKVNSLLSEYIFFSWKSEIRYTAKLGNGVVIDKTVTHASGSLRQDLNGCIAEGVMYLLNDQKVRAYLAEKN